MAGDFGINPFPCAVYQLANPRQRSVPVALCPFLHTPESCKFIGNVLAAVTVSWSRVLFQVTFGKKAEDYENDQGNQNDNYMIFLTDLYI